MLISKNCLKEATTKEASLKIPVQDFGLKVKLLKLDKGKTYSSMI